MASGLFSMRGTHNILKSITYPKSCKKRVETSSMIDRDSKAYCKVCYGKLFAPKVIYTHKLKTDRTRDTDLEVADHF